MARVTRGDEWVAQAPEAEVNQAISDIAAQHELSVRRSGEVLELSGGSQASMRLKGAWASAPGALPKKGRVRCTTADDGIRVRVDLEDSMGFGFMDKKTRRKYSETLDSIMHTFETTLASVGAPEPKAAPGSQDGGESMASQLSHLAKLHGEGALTGEEFAAAKQKLLA